MRKLLLLMALCATQLLLSQNWCPPGATWYYRDFNDKYEVYKDGTLELRYTATVTVNNTVCKEIKGTFHGAVSPLNPTYTTVIANYVTYRTYESNKVLYVFNVNQQNFDTVANFNAAIGDKWRYAMYNSNCTNQNVPHAIVTVYDTGHVTINGFSLKKLVVSPPSATVQTLLVERIGGVTGFLFQSENCNQDGGSLGEFSCYSDSTFPNYSKPGLPSCNFNTVSLQERSRPNAFVKLHPNPGTGFYTVDLPVAGALRVYDQLGKLLYEKTGLQTGQTELHLEHLSPGVYVLNAQTDAGSGYLRFIRE